MNTTARLVIDQPAPQGFRLLFTVVLLMEIIAAILILVSDIPFSGKLLGLGICVVTGAFIWMLRFARIQVEETPEAIKFRFAPFYTRSIQRTQIEEVRRAGLIEPRKFGGTGLRFARGNQMALLWGAGPGVAVRTHNGEETYVVGDFSDVDVESWPRR